MIESALLAQLATDLADLRKRVKELEGRESPEYSFGTFTPTYNGVTPGTTTYTTQFGSYTRIGRLVIAQGYLVWTATTGTGVVRLGGLPFTSLGPSSSYQFAFPVWTNNVTFANGSVQGVLQGGQTQAQLYSPITNGASTELTVEAAGDIRYTIVYFTS